MSAFIFYYAQLSLILLFLREEINYFTFFLFLLIPIQKRWSKIPFFDKIFGLFSFIFSYVIAGHQVNPEMGLNLLVAVVSLKLLESKNIRDYRMTTLGLFLVWGTGGLFDKSIAYFLLSFCMIIYSVFFLLNLGEFNQQTSGKRFAIWILKALPFAVLFFFFQPRFHSSLWSPPQKLNQGEIGFTEDAKPSEVSEILPSDKISFYANLTPDSSRDLLYWRGVTLSGSDGWNWTKTELDIHYPSLMPMASVSSPGWIKQEIIHKTTPERAFGLERPLWWILGDKEVKALELGSFGFHHFRSYKRYKVVSGPQSQAPLKQHLNKLTKSKIKKLVGLPQSVKSLEKGVEEIQRFFQTNGFLYSLSPGKLLSLEEFLRVKKGWCTHYASASGEILRYWGFPVRLVSGYLGGDKIEGEPYYTITENDAHVWLEVFSNNAWVKIDPTLWVMPERLTISGREMFVRAKKKWDPRSFYPPWLLEASSLIDKANFKFMLWLEDFDREKQKEIAQKFDLNLSEFYMLIVWVLLIFISVFFIQEWLRNRQSPGQKRIKAWKKFLAKHKIPYRPDLTVREASLLLSSEDSRAIEELAQLEFALYAAQSTDLKANPKRTIPII